MIHDLSPPISPRLGVWPGDTPPTREVLMNLERGDTVTLSTLRTTVHLGAHADGPNHYHRAGRDVAAQPLEHYLGPCQVVEARVERGGLVEPRSLVGELAAIGQPRVLIRTGTFPSYESWNSDFAGLSVELIDALAALPLTTLIGGAPRRGVVTIGVDTPSVDPQTSKSLDAHHAIARHDIAILEGLALAGVPPGVYDLVALPLRLEGFDGSPVRAVLRPLTA
ncbi:MAG: cyclase family protein [Phycisphaerales bacterium]